MKQDYIKYAWDNLKHRKLRSWLTILSILIGIAAIYALVSFGQGLGVYVDEISNQVGKDKLIIQSKVGGAPGADSNFFLTDSEVSFIERVNGIKEVTAIYVQVADVLYDKEKKFAFIMSMNRGKKRKLLEEAFALELGKGRLLKQNDKFKAVLGYNYQFDEEIFKKSLRLRDKIDIKGVKFEIVGFYKSLGNPQDDSNIYVTDEAMEILYPDTVGEYQFGIARAHKDVATADLAALAENKLRKFQGLDEGEERFSIVTFQQAIEVFNNVLQVINVVLVLIAFISLVVAGVNIMNTMYTSVLERTQEIGVMKSIGAKNADIMTLFLIESGLLGLAGGILGVLFGYAIAKTGGSIAASAGYSLLSPVFPWQLTVGSLLFAFLVGSLSGLFPAMRAAKLKPVDALRYE
jgi:putative ABC transport system permease protein